MKVKYYIPYIAAAIFLIAIWIIFKKEPIPYDEKFIKQQTDSLNQENKKLRLQIDSTKKKAAVYSSRIDSLSALKPKVIIRYEEKSKFIDGANTSVVISEFNRILSDTFN